MRWIVVPALVLGACATSDDPADGGFFSGVAGVTSGSYQGRVDALEAEAQTERERQAALQAELSGLEQQHASLKLRLTEQRSRLAAGGVPVPADVEAAVSAAVTSNPGGQSDAERLEALRAAVADAQALSERLANLAG
ncbi:MAG: hypothetical protein AAF913_12435 [Pseudomonadota bacterium]